MTDIKFKDIDVKRWDSDGCLNAAVKQLEKEGCLLIDLTNAAKPCPMCGSKHIFILYPKINVIYRVYIQCADCGLSGYQIVFQDVDIDDAMERTIKYWNTRV